MRTSYRLGARDPISSLPRGITEPIGTSKTHKWVISSLVLAFAFQPILHPGGPANTSPVDLFLIASIACFLVWVKRQPRRLWVPYLLPVGLMVGAGAASGITSQFPSTALQALLVDILLFAWCTVIANTATSPLVLQRILTAWAVSGVGWALLVVLGWLGHIHAIEGLNAADGNRVLFAFGDPNYAATFWVATLFVIYAVQKPATRWIRVVGYLLVFWALVLTESNGGFLSLAVGIAFVLLVKTYKRHGWAGVTAVALTLGLIVGTFFTLVPLNTLREKALYSNQPLLVNSIGRSAQSSSERSELVTEMGHLYNQTNGILGIGPGATKPILAAQMAVYPNEAHDDWLAALVERGPIGLIGLLILVGSAILWCGPLVRGRVPKRFAVAVPIPMGLVAGLLALGVNSFYEEILHFRFLWALLALVAVLGRESRSGAWSGVVRAT